MSESNNEFKQWEMEINFTTVKCWIYQDFRIAFNIQYLQKKEKLFSFRYSNKISCYVLFSLLNKMSENITNKNK